MDKQFKIAIETVVKQTGQVATLVEQVERLVKLNESKGKGQPKEAQHERDVARLKELQADHEQQMADLQRRALPKKKQLARLEKEIAKQKRIGKLATGNPAKQVAAKRRELSLQREMTSVQQRGASQMQSLMKNALILAATYKALNLGKDFVSSGFEFNQTVEDATFGIAGIMRQFDKFGSIESFDAAMDEAGLAIDSLALKAAKSPASLQQLIGAYQALSGPLTAANLDLTEQIDLITLMSQTLGALSIRPEQILQESRALVTGNITEDAQAARILGITKAQIDSAKEMGTLYEFLTESMVGFSESAERSTKTMTQQTSRLGDEIDQLAGILTSGAFDDSKSAIGDLADLTEKLRKQLEELSAHDKFVRAVNVPAAAITAMVSDEAILKSLGGIFRDDGLGGVTIAPTPRGDSTKENLLGSPIDDKAYELRLEALLDRIAQPAFRALLNRATPQDRAKFVQYEEELLRVYFSVAERAEKIRSDDEARVEANKEIARQKELAEGMAKLETEHETKLDALRFSQLDTLDQMSELEQRLFTLHEKRIGMTDLEDATAADILKVKADELGIVEKLAKLQAKLADENERAAKAAAQEVLAAAELAGYAVSENGDGFVRNKLSRYDTSRAGVFGQEIFSSEDGVDFTGTGQFQGGLADPMANFQDNLMAAEAAIFQYRATVGTVADQINGELVGIFTSLEAGVTTNMTELIKGTKSWDDALADIGDTILTSVLQAIIRMATQWIISRTLMATVGESIGMAGTASAAAQALTLNALWQPAALAASIASYGGAAAAGSSAYMAAKGAMAGTSFLGGFADGGLVAGGPGFIAINERGLSEFVVNGPAVQRHRGLLEDINAGKPIEPQQVGSGTNGQGGTSTEIIIVPDLAAAYAAAADRSGMVNIREMKRSIRRHGS